MTTEAMKLHRAYLAKKRTDKKFTVRKLALQADLHWTTVYDIFNGKSTTLDSIGKLAKALGMTFNVRVGKKGRAA